MQRSKREQRPTAQVPLRPLIQEFLSWRSKKKIESNSITATGLEIKNLFKNNLLLKRIRKNLSIGVAGSSLLLLLSLGRTALLTKNLPIDDYGRILVVLNFFGFLSIFLGVRVNDFIYRFFPQFKERQENAKLKGILLIAFVLSLLVGLIVGSGTYAGSFWISQTFYNDQAYVPLFRIYALAAFFMAFEGFYTSILRLHDKFILIVIPQVAGAAVSLIAIVSYILYVGSLSIEFAVWSITIGMLITTVPALLSAFFCIKPVIGKSKKNGLFALKSHRRKIVSNLFQTNLIGYLKFGADTGGMFLLGLLSTPAQVALYGIARQLVGVLQVVQNNIQNAVTPEIVSLWAKKNIMQLYKLVNTYTRWSLIVGVIISVIAVFIAKPVILIFTTPDYLKALPVFYVFIFTTYLTFVSLAFFPLALAMDKLGRRNLVVSTRLVYLGIGAVIGLNAMVLAAVQLLGIITVRLFNDMPLLKSLKTMALKE